MKIFYKERLSNGRRHIYFCGIKIASYCKKPTIDISMFKSDIIKHKALLYCDNVITIILGSSHGRDGYIPDKKSLNLANSSQDLYRAYKVYEYVIKQNDKNLQNIILFWSVFHPGLQLEKTQEYLKCVPYKAFYNIPYLFDFPIKDNLYIKSIKKEYKKTQLPPNYRGKSLWNINHDYEITSELVAKHIKNTKRNNNQIQWVQKILDLAHKHNHRLYIVLPPYRSDYLNCLPADKDIYFELLNFLDKNSDVKLLNFQRDKDFHDSDFDSADHCNEKGAKKLTDKINNVIYHAK